MRQWNNHLLANSHNDRQVKFGQVLVLLSCLALTGYFAFHANHGRYGLEVREKLIARSVLLEFEIKSLETVRAKLSHEVELLASDPPHPDLVEEIARNVLGYARAKDQIYQLR